MWFRKEAQNDLEKWGCFAGTAGHFCGWRLKDENNYPEIKPSSTGLRQAVYFHGAIVRHVWATQEHVFSG